MPLLPGIQQRQKAIFECENTSQKPEIEWIFSMQSDALSLTCLPLAALKPFFSSMAKNIIFHIDIVANFALCKNKWKIIKLPNVIKNCYRMCTFTISLDIVFYNQYLPKLCNQVPSLSLSRWRTLTLLKNIKRLCVFMGREEIIFFFFSFFLKNRE